ncbi:rhomboid family-domain-containing protein [Spinellus fusiger]|nr:rhomboid family-domain-containing protein [Spinellus fusiger]
MEGVLSVCQIHLYTSTAHTRPKSPFVSIFTLFSILRSFCSFTTDCTPLAMSRHGTNTGAMNASGEWQTTYGREAANPHSVTDQVVFPTTSSPTPGYSEQGPHSSQSNYHSNSSAAPIFRPDDKSRYNPLFTEQVGSNTLHQRHGPHAYDTIAMNSMSRDDGYTQPLYQQQPPYQQPPYGYAYATPPPPLHGQVLPYGHDRGLAMRFFCGPVINAWFSWLTGWGMLGVLIYELVTNYQLTGSVIETNPFNPMVGPSSTVLIHLGARFTPCMRPLPDYTNSTLLAGCYRTPQDTCSLEQLCGLGGFEQGLPNQWYRLILPIFLHAGVIHFLLNMMTHLRLGVSIERSIGMPRYILLYMSSGVWGFILSAMLSQGRSPSMGCSGALFGLIGYTLVDIIVSWRTNPNICGDLTSLTISIIVSLVLGLLPGLDNFAHIGGFVVGIFMGIFMAPIRVGSSRTTIGVRWTLRIIAIAIVVVMFGVAIKEFYEIPDPKQICPNCKYLSCLPVRDWCDSS